VTTLAETLAQDRRGIILRVLVDQGDFALNEGVLQDALDSVGHKVARDLVRDDLSWLQRHGLVSIVELKGGDLWVANLTKRGEEVAQGRERVPGVKRASPKE
jgi:hypothetical protein